MSTINTIPVEILTYIFLLARRPVKESSDPYLSYTWVCRHWRSILIHNPAFWTLIHRKRWQPKNDFANTFHDELLRRSESAELDVVLPYDPTPFISKIKNLFAKESNRIRNLVVNIIDLTSFERAILNEQRFTSLRGLSLPNCFGSSHLLSALAALDQLETLELGGCEQININIPRNRIALIFSRIRNLKLTVSTCSLFVRAALSSSVRLEKLRLIMDNLLTSGQEEAVIILPELQILSIGYPTVLKYLDTPKIASLDIKWGPIPPLGSFDYQIFKDFNVQSIRYLYTPKNFNWYSSCILGSKDPIHCTSFFSGSINFELDFLIEDEFREYSRDCFRFRFESETTFITALLLILSRLQNLTELHLLHSTVHHPPPAFIPVTLPELRFLTIEDSSPLLEYIRVSKLSSLNVKWTPNTNVSTWHIWNEFHFPSIKYLKIRCSDDLGNKGEDEHGNYCILGSTRPVDDCKPFHLAMNNEQILSKPHGECPRDCFHFTFQKSTNTFAKAFRGLKVASLAFPRSINLIELDLLFPCTLHEFKVIISLTPLIQKVIIRHGCKLIDFIRFLNNTSVLPRLKHLYFATFLIPQNLEKYAQDVGELLTTCLKYRQENSAHVESELKHIVLRNCPPLPTVWLDELEKLGVTEIITETEATNVINKGPTAHNRERFSDADLNIINSA